MRYLMMAIPLLLASAYPAFADTPEEKGLAIALEAEKRDEGWNDSRSVMEMVLKNVRGQESLRLMRGSSLEVPGDGDKTLMVFDNPKDVKGTSMLTWSHKSGDDDQWLFLPALKRVKRISSSNKSGSFMGSEFSYEDLSSREVEKYSHKWLRDEPCPGDDFNGLECYVVETVPLDKESGYTKIIGWMDKVHYRSCMAEFYDRKNTKLKTLTMSKYARYLDRFWRPGRLDMVNHQSGKSTSLVFSEYKFGVGLSDPDFDQNALQRMK